MKKKKKPHKKKFRKFAEMRGKKFSARSDEKFFLAERNPLLSESKKSRTEVRDLTNKA